MIDTSMWKEFHLYDIFDIDMGNKMDRGKMSDGDIAFVGRTANNNGINARVGKVINHEKYGTVEPYKKGCITLALGGSIGSCFIQEEQFYTSQNVAVLMPKTEQSEYALRFITTVITHSVLHGKYEAFTEELNKHIKTDFVVSLPATSDSQPDWAYMESYMKRIMVESEKSLENLKKADDTKHQIDVSRWTAFPCEDLFECKNTGNILARDVEDGSGNTPFVTASGYNNGVVGYIDASKYQIIKGHCILVGGKTFTITYQKDDFVSNDSHNFVIRVKGYDISDLAYLFLVAEIYSYFGQKYSWNDAVTKDKLLGESIPLPQTAAGEPDWQYMEEYMDEILKKSEDNINIISTCI